MKNKSIFTVGVIMRVFLISVSSLVSAAAPVEDRSSFLNKQDEDNNKQGKDNNVITRVDAIPSPQKKPDLIKLQPVANQNPLLPSDDPDHKASWLTQVNEIKNKYHVRRRNNLKTFQTQFDQLGAYGLIRLEKYKSKSDLIAGAQKSKLAYQAIKRYRANRSLNDKYFIDAYDHINADLNTRNKLIQILKKGLNSTKAKSQERLIYLEEHLFLSLYRIYQELSNNTVMWDIKNGGFDFKNARLKARYKLKERKLNNSIRELQVQREVSKEEG